MHCDVVHITTLWVSSLTLDCNGVFAIKAYNDFASNSDVASNSDLEELAKKTTNGDCAELANIMNDFLSVSDHLPRLDKDDNTPYSRRGHVQPYARLGGQIRAALSKSCYRHNCYFTLRHLLHDALVMKTRVEGQGLALFGSVNRVYEFTVHEELPDEFIISVVT